MSYERPVTRATLPGRAVRTTGVDAEESEPGRARVVIRQDTEGFLGLVDEEKLVSWIVRKRQFLGREALGTESRPSFVRIKLKRRPTMPENGRAPKTSMLLGVEPGRLTQEEHRRGRGAC
jgi:hypothetical protein